MIRGDYLSRRQIKTFLLTNPRSGTFCQLALPCCWLADHHDVRSIEPAHREIISHQSHLYLIFCSDIETKNFFNSFFAQFYWWKLQLLSFPFAFSAPRERALDSRLNEPCKDGSQLYWSTGHDGINHRLIAVSSSDVEDVARKLCSIADYFPFRESINLIENRICALYWWRGKRRKGMLEKQKLLNVDRECKKNVICWEAEKMKQLEKL